MAKRGAASRGALAVLAGFIILTSSAWTPVTGAPDAGEDVAVWGGTRALAEMAGMDAPRPDDDFFFGYCRNIVVRSRLGWDPAILDDLDVYSSSVAELYRLSDHGRLELSVRLPSRRATTLRVLELLGWRVKTEGDRERIVPGSGPEDAVRTRISGALGWDVIEITRVLSSGSGVCLALPSGNAVVRDAQKWAQAAGGVPAGGYAQLFARNPQMAMAYVGLASMGAAAGPLMESVGLRKLVNKFAKALWVHGHNFAVSCGHAVVPGGPPAEGAWGRLVGARADEPGRFFRAVLEKDGGRLASFYTALAQADNAHQRYFTRTASLLGRFYRWFKTADEPLRHAELAAFWKDDLLRGLPLDAAGSVRFPGGQGAWTDSKKPVDDVLEVKQIEALVPIANLERARRAPLDEVSARLLATHYISWQNLLPHLEQLPALGRQEFEALAAFEHSLESRPHADLNAIVGEWFSLVKLIELGVRAGSLTPEAASRAFRRACQALASQSYSSQAIEVLHEIAGNTANLDDFVAVKLLRLNGKRRTDFDQVKRLLGVPSLSHPTGQLDQWALFGLSGIVYAALLDPNLPLITSDPLLLTKHQFVYAADAPFIFCRSGVQLRSEPPGSYFFGGFMLFEQTAASLLRWEVNGAAEPRCQPPEASVEGGAAAPLFRASARLVEVYASVTDARGRYLSRLDQSDFRLLDNGEPVEIHSFEDGNSQGSIALLLDITGSMRGSLSALKISALRLIDELRPADSVALYPFNEEVREAIDFTTDKDAVKRAVLSLGASGGTALHDALADVAHRISRRPGKKAIVLFTDGADTASLLTMDNAVRQAELAGAPVYTVAYGDALAIPRLAKQLADIARATGGLSFTVRNPQELEMPFQRIAEDLTHGYVLAFKPRATERHEWRTVETILRDPKGRTVRAREGYYP